MVGNSRFLNKYEHLLFLMFNLGVFLLAPGIFD